MTPHERRAERARTNTPPPRMALPLNPQARYLRLLQAWVECLPHQTGKRRFIEGALVRARREAVRP